MPPLKKVSHNGKLFEIPDYFDPDLVQGPGGIPNYEDFPPDEVRLAEGYTFPPEDVSGSAEGYTFPPDDLSEGGVPYVNPNDPTVNPPPANLPDFDPSRVQGAQITPGQYNEQYVADTNPTEIPGEAGLLDIVPPPPGAPQSEWGPPHSDVLPQVDSVSGADIAPEVRDPYSVSPEELGPAPTPPAEHWSKTYARGIAEVAIPLTVPDIEASIRATDNQLINEGLNVLAEKDRLNKEQTQIGQDSLAADSKITAQRRQLQDQLAGEIAGIAALEAANLRQWDKDEKARQLEAKVRPNRLWHDASPLSKAGMLFSIVLGGLGSGATGGYNAALLQLNKMVEADIDAQEYNIESGRKDSLTNKQSILTRSKNKVAWRQLETGYRLESLADAVLENANNYKSQTMRVDAEKFSQELRGQGLAMVTEGMSNFHGSARRETEYLIKQKAARAAAAAGAAKRAEEQRRYERSEARKDRQEDRADAEAAADIAKKRAETSGISTEAAGGPQGPVIDYDPEIMPTKEGVPVRAVTKEAGPELINYRIDYRAGMRVLDEMDSLIDKMAVIKDPTEGKAKFEALKSHRLVDSGALRARVSDSDVVLINKMFGGDYANFLNMTSKRSLKDIIKTGRELQAKKMADQTHFLTGGTGSFGEKPRLQEKPLAEQSQEELGIKLTATAKRLAPVKPEQPASRVSQTPKETRKYEIARPVAAEPTTAEATALSDAQTKELKEELDTITSTYLRTIDLSRKGKEKHSLTKGAVDIENLVKEGGNVPVRVVVDSKGNVLVGEIVEGELKAISGGVSSVEMPLKELGSKLRKNQVVDVDELVTQQRVKKAPGELPKFMQDIETEISRRRRQSNKE